MKNIMNTKFNAIVKMLCKRLAKLYIKNIDYCINTNKPSLSFMRQHIKGRCEPYGVMVDSVVDCRDMPNLVLNGESYGIASYGGYSVSRIYARHKSDLFVMVSECAILTVEAYDDATVDIRTIGVNARVIVYLYGNAKVKRSGVGIRVRNRQSVASTAIH